MLSRRKIPGILIIQAREGGWLRYLREDYQAHSAPLRPTQVEESEEKFVE